MSTKDYVEANNPAIFSYLNEQGLIPEYVMKSACVTSEETDGLNAVAFADPYNRAYPCHTKAACWQSAAWFAGNHEETPHVKEAIEKMAAFHGIEQDVKDVFNCFESEFNKVAHAEIVDDEPQYALSLDFGGDFGRGQQNHYPINTYHEIIRSGEAAAEDYYSRTLPMPIMRKVASTLIKAATAHDVPMEEMPTVVCQFGIQRLPDPYAAQVLVGIRKQAGINTDPYIALLDELQNAMTKIASHEEAINLANAVAEEMFDLDYDNGVRYSNRMPTPYDIIFTGPTVNDMEKFAASTVDIMNVSVPVVDFLNLSDEKIDAVFSQKLGAVIKQAKAHVAGNPDMEKTAAAEELLSTLPPEANKILLATLADVAW